MSECFVINCGKNGSCILYHVSYRYTSIMSHLSCLWYHVLCFMSPASCLLSRISCIMSPVSSLTYPVPRLLSPVSHLKSHNSCLTYKNKIYLIYFGTSLADPEQFNTDPDNTFIVDADPEPDPLAMKSSV